MPQALQLLPLAKIIGRDLELEMIEGLFLKVQAPRFPLLDLREPAAETLSLAGAGSISGHTPVESVEPALELEPAGVLFARQSLQILLPPPPCLLGENRCGIGVGMSRREKDREEQDKNDVFHATHVEDPHNKMSSSRCGFAHPFPSFHGSSNACCERARGLESAEPRDPLMPERVLATLVRKSREGAEPSTPEAPPFSFPVLLLT